MVRKKTVYIDVRKSSHHITNEDFIRVYCTSASVGEVAKRCGVAEITVYNRRKKLSDIGVELPKFKRQPKYIDVPALKKLVRQLTKK